MSDVSTPMAAELADWVVSLHWNDLPTRMQDRTRLWVMDSLGLMVAAHGYPPGAAVRRVAASQGGAAEASVVVSGELLPAPLTTLVHGTLAHSFDYDDTFPESVVHPGSLVVPAALAGSQATGGAIRDLLTAVVAGYEVAARLGAAAGRRFHARGFHASGVVGPLVAAAVSAKIMGLDASSTVSAMGSAGSMGGGLMEFLSDGSSTKRLHPGWAGQGGMLAARIAAEGFTGPSTVLEGRNGLFSAFLGMQPDAALVHGLGDRFASEQAEFKFYPCAHVIHPFLDAAIALRQDGLEPDRIVAVELAVAPWYVPIVCEPRNEKIAPTTEYQARASLPFAVAAALLDGRVGLATFDDATIERSDVLALAKRVQVIPDQMLDRGFSGRLRVRLQGGRTLDGPLPEVTGRVSERVEDKFAALTTVLSAAEQVPSLLRRSDVPVSALLDALRA